MLQAAVEYMLTCNHAWSLLVVVCQKIGLTQATEHANDAAIDSDHKINAQDLLNL